MDETVEYLLEQNLRTIVRRKFKLRSLAANEVADDLLQQVTDDVVAKDIRLNPAITKEIPYKEKVETWHENMKRDDELVRAIHRSADMPMIQARKCLIILIHEIEDSLSRGQSFMLQEFGTFAAIAQAQSLVNTNDIGSGSARRRPFKYKFKSSKRLGETLN